eukprot:gb/GECH01013925.1/.p1 GENE.gb/GECH01013925.1/~~gb/GECH01013925.1/.p1  ORF type:complete len:490 (+),score=137.99 gb/GECH01013925.1/:1-1470(+)
MGKKQKKSTFEYPKTKDGFPAWFENILISAEVVDKRYPAKGMPVFMPYGFHMHNAIMNILEKEWDKMEVLKAQFPTFVPESFLKRETENFSGFSPECFWVTHGGDTKLAERYALRPTSETAMYSTFALWVRSFRDLPLKVHQTCSVFRYETKDTLPLIRAREIYWNEGHSCHQTREEAVEFLEKVWDAYLYLIQDRLGVFGLRLRRPVWDQFPGCEHTDVMDSVLPSGKVLQIVGAHYLGQKFSKPFDIKFLDPDNNWLHPYMTCFGVSTRILASALSVHGDDSGLVLPPSIAPYHIVITPILKKGDESAPNAAKEWKKKLVDAGYRVVVDDSAKKPGEKYFFWEMKGVPLRIEIGPRDLEKEQLCVVRRDTKKKEFIPFENIINHVQDSLNDFHSNLSHQAKEVHQSQIQECTTLDEVKQVMEEKGGFARVPFCALDESGKEGDQKIHDETGGEVRGFIPSEAAPSEGTKCIATGKPATVYVYVAKAY